MRQFVIDQLTMVERDNLDSYLKRTLQPGSLPGLFWLMLPDDLLSDTQQGHGDCGPYCFVVELEEESLKFELLVRSQSNMHCDCIAYATPAQREFVLRFADKMLAEELIRA